MGAFGIWQWVIVLLVVVLLFGSKKLRSLGGDLGVAVRGFKQGLKSDGTALEADATDTTIKTETANPETNNAKDDRGHSA